MTPEQFQKNWLPNNFKKIDSRTISKKKLNFALLHLKLPFDKCGVYDYSLFFPERYYLSNIWPKDKI